MPALLIIFCIQHLGVPRVVSNIHPLASVHPQAKIGCSVTIGPFCVVEENVVLGDGCLLGSHVVIKRGTTLGENNHIGDAAILGGLPQHVQAGNSNGHLVLGRENTVREFATIHRALDSSEKTMIGNNCLIMIGVHVAHDCHVGNHAILVNNVMLAGHVVVEERAYLGGGAAVHQFCRVGKLSMVGGMARVTQDVLPYVTIDGASTKVVGLNLIGLRRFGFNQNQIAELKEAYRVIYRRSHSWEQVTPMLETQFPQGPASLFAHFIRASQRGITPERRGTQHTTLKFRGNHEPAVAQANTRKAG